MTPPLLPAVATPPRTAVVSDDTGPFGRWVLHRAGLLNVWQYDRVQLRFGGGRLLLRGKNGAGKSKALEVMLPFLLDGDTRRLDATGRDRTTVSWLMTDGRAAGNHVGYVWLELRCDDGDERFLTLGAGLKASSATRRSDAWFFITDQRIGVDVELDRAGECLSIERLKEVLGDDAVTASGAEHRRRVGRHVFGLFDEARYSNLLHLLHRLRDPNIGNRVEAGELATVLSEALPPIDDTVLQTAAGRFDDLDAIREQVDRSQQTANALARFLETYRGYARTLLQRRARRVTTADAARAAAARELRHAERAIADADHELEDAGAALATRHAERVAAEDERRALERSEAYRAHQDLVDREARVEALDTAASTAEAAATRAGDAARRATAEAAATDRAMRVAFDETISAARVVADLADDAGMDRDLVGPDVARSSDGTPDEASVHGAADRGRRAQILVAARQHRAREIRVLAVRAERAIADADGAAERSAESEAALDAERTSTATVRRARHDAERTWSEQVAAWTLAAPEAASAVDWSPVGAVLADRADRADRAWVDDVRAGVVEALAPAIDAARHDAAVADARSALAAEAVIAAAERLSDVEAQHDARPVPGPFHSASRDAASGAPFYELVDVSSGIAADVAAGVEAALAASGLLDAWVSADGVVVHPRTHDTLLRADSSERPASSLTAVLVPAVDAAGPVGHETVHAVLTAIGFGDDSGATTWVASDGRWSVGALHGAWSKSDVEFLGAGARQRTRLRRLAELRTQLGARRAEHEAARRTAVGTAARRDELESLAATLPSAALVVQAAQDLAAAERSLGVMVARHEQDRRAAEVARATASRLAAELAHEAGGDGLPSRVDALDAVIAAIADLRHALGEHRRALETLVDRLDRWRGQVALLAEREREATEVQVEAAARRAEHRSAAHELATLRAALATSVAQVLRDLTAVERRLDELQHRLIPAAQDRRDAAVEARSAAAAQHRLAVDGDAEAASEVVLAIDGVQTALALPGLVLAATGRDDVPTADVAAARALLAELEGQDEVADSTVLARYDRLSQELAGGYDTAIDEVDGVKVVHIDDDNGRQPLAAVARRLAAEAEAARGRLAAREREVLERFLLGELGDEVRSKLLDAHDLLSDTNRTLAAVRTSHGKGAHLEWALRDDAAAPAAVAARLLVDELRGEDGDVQLRDALLTLIEGERAADPTASYEQHLRVALDYRTWHRFAVRVTEPGAPGSGRILSNRLGLSQGEQRVLSYLALFAAAAAQFDAIARGTPTAPRLLLLDDAFAKVDEPTHGRLLGLLVELQLDFVVTSERLWGCFPEVPSLEIYEAIRDPAEIGVALVHFRWDGRRRSLVGV